MTDEEVFQGWKKIDEDPPPEDQLVLVLEDFGDHWMPHIARRSVNENGDWMILWNGDSIPLDDAVWWQPIDVLPKEPDPLRL